MTCDLNGTIGRPSKILRSMELLSEKPRRSFTIRTHLKDEDADHSDDESRFVIIGLSSQRLLFVVFRGTLGNLITYHISARADSVEKKCMNEQNHDL